jgi:Ca2+-binding EF-hand superfamily protein
LRGVNSLIMSLKLTAVGFAGLCLALPTSGFAQAVDLSEAELAQLFYVFDTDENGSVTKSELKAVIKSFRVGFDEREVEQMMTSYDASKDGALQAGEFSRLMVGFGQDEDEVTRQMEQAFLRYDANRDGGLDASEVKTLMEASGNTMSLREAKGIVFEADLDGNGRIDTAEFGRTAG